MSIIESLLFVIAGLLVIIMLWVAAIHGTISGAIERHRSTVDYRKPHVFDPIGYAIDECECGLVRDAEIHSAVGG